MEIINGNMRRDNITGVPSQLSGSISLMDLFNKEFVIVHGKVFLNIHQFDDSILETHRINHLLSLGMVVVSERSVVDSKLDAEYQDVVYFENNVEDMYQRALFLVKNDHIRQERALLALAKYEEIMNSNAQLQDAMASAFL